MKLLIQTTMIFFGTLLCAAVVALGEPVKSDVALARGAQGFSSHESKQHAAGLRSWIAIAAKTGISPPWR